jgi:hypothetical protein
MSIDLESTIEYYTNLLIIQYNQLEKAKATIDLHVRTLLSDNIASQVQDGYSLDTAVGVQLDVLGKYIGTDRFYNSIEASGDFFGMTSYDTLGSDTTVGFTDYANYLTDSGGFLTYNGLFVAGTLDDEDYRFMLKLRIVQNNSNHSNGEIDEGLFSFFGTDLVLSDTKKMQIFYFVSGANLNLAVIAFSKGLLPRPMGVGLGGLIKRDKKMFGFTNYNTTAIPSMVTGFTNYTDGFTKEGEILTYDKVISL